MEIRVKQGTKEWFNARQMRVTASQIAAIMGVDPYRSRDDIMLQFVEQYRGIYKPQEPNIAMQYGTQHEQIARLAYIDEFDEEVRECGFFVSDEYDFIGASPDGVIWDNQAILEIKCPYKYRDSADISPPSKGWVYQAQFQMMVTGIPCCRFYQWSPHGTRLDFIFAEPVIQSRLLLASKAFIDEFIATRDDYVLPETVEINTVYSKRLVDEYDEISESIDIAQARKKEIIEELASMTDGNNGIISGKKLTKVERKGNINYNQIMDENLPEFDVEPFRSKSTEYWKLS